MSRKAGRSRQLNPLSRHERSYKGTHARANAHARTNGRQVCSVGAAVLGAAVGVRHEFTVEQWPSDSLPARMWHLHVSHSQSLAQVLNI